MDARTSRYHEVYARSMRDPEGFWGEAAQAIDWYEPAKKVFDKDAGVYGRWFTGASCNTCYNAIDRHVERGRADQPAIIYDSPVTGSKQTISYAALLRFGPSRRPESRPSRPPRPSRPSRRPSPPRSPCGRSWGAAEPPCGAGEPAWP